MKYANIKTKEITDVLPTQIGATWNPTMEQLAEYGWRKIERIDEPQAGFRLITQGIEELSSTTCKLTVVESVNIAEEEAAKEKAEADRQAAAQAAADKAKADYELRVSDIKNWQKELRFILAMLKPAIQTLMTEAEYKTWLESEWKKMT